MKELLVMSRTLPDSKQIYGDSFSIHAGDNNMLGHWEGSACPNGGKTDKATGKILTYRQAYAWIKPQIIKAQCIIHHKYHKCLLLAGGGAIPARYDNPNPDSTCKGKPFAAGIFCHSGFSRTCRGSAGCLTINPAQWSDFINHFNVNEALSISIIDMLQGKGAA